MYHLASFLLEPANPKRTETGKSSLEPTRKSGFVNAANNYLFYCYNKQNKKIYFIVIAITNRNGNGKTRTK